MVIVSRFGEKVTSVLVIFCGRSLFGLSLSIVCEC